VCGNTKKNCQKNERHWGDPHSIMFGTRGGQGNKKRLGEGKS